MGNSNHDIQVEPEELDELGSGGIPDLADDYDDLLHRIAEASRLRDSAFGDPPAGARGGLKAEWNDQYDTYYRILYESAVNIRAFGDYLVRVANNYRDLEVGLEQGFNEAEESIEAGDYNAAPGDYATPPPAPGEKDTPEVYGPQPPSPNGPQTAI